MPAEPYVPDRMGEHSASSRCPIDARRTPSGPARCRAIHGDPLDRMLVAQGQVEDVPIVTADPLIGRYDVETIW